MHAHMTQDLALEPFSQLWYLTNEPARTLTVERAANRRWMDQNNRFLVIVDDKCHTKDNCEHYKIRAMNVIMLIRAILRTCSLASKRHHLHPLAVGS